MTATGPAADPAAERGGGPGAGPGAGPGDWDARTYDRIADPMTRWGAAVLDRLALRGDETVLDAGAGSGRVTEMLLERVPNGRVVALDAAASMLTEARRRLARFGDQVRFVEGDVNDPAPGGPFDAIVERLVLWTVPDPAALLRRQATVLRPGGLVVPIEVDLSTIRSLPETGLGTKGRAWVVEAFAKAGMSMLGPRLWAIVREAGLRPLGMIGVQPHFGPGDEVGIAFLVETMRVAAPLIVGTGVATAEEIGMETLEQRLTDEGQRSQAVRATPMLLSAWATTGPE